MLSIRSTCSSYLSYPSAPLNKSILQQQGWKGKSETSRETRRLQVRLQGQILSLPGTETPGGGAGQAIITNIIPHQRCRYGQVKTNQSRAHPFSLLIWSYESCTPNFRAITIHPHAANSIIRGSVKAIEFGDCLLAL